jgi:hypothetical protein
MSNKADSEDDAILEMRHVRNYEDFSCIDNSLQCYYENEDCEEQLLNKLQQNTT